MRRWNLLQRKFRRNSALALIGATFSFAHSAHADAIDGDWCHSNGKRMSIRGPAIITPVGQETRGNYTRHFFSYVIPGGETQQRGKKRIDGPPPQPTLPAVRHAILELFARIPPQRCPHCRKWICSGQRHE